MSSDASLDLDAETFRQLGHQLVDLMAEALELEREEPILEKVSGGEIRDTFEEALPRRGTAPEIVLDECRALFRGTRRNGHPRFFGYVCSSADPIGILGDGLTSALNQNLTAWRSSPAAATIERLVIRWLDQITGFGGGGCGLLTSGGSAANLQALACAISLAEERAGLGDGDRRRFTIYISRETHLSLGKAARLLGLAPDHVRLIDVDPERRMQVDHLVRRVEEDLRGGLMPIAVCVSAGTSNTGAIDPLDEAVDVAVRHRLWFHVDGAYGAPAAMVPEYRWMKRAFARADSLTIDPHKWLYTPIDTGCLLVRDASATARAFRLDSEYVAVTQTDPLESHAFFHHGIELTRRFRALKIWMILKARGTDALAAAIAANIAARRHLDLPARPRSPAARAPGLRAVDQLFPLSSRGPCRQRDDQRGQPRDPRDPGGGGLLLHVQAPTTLDGKYSLRVCIVSFRTTERDIDRLIEEVLRLGVCRA